MVAVYDGDLQQARIYLNGKLAGARRHAKLTGPVRPGQRLVLGHFDVVVVDPDGVVQSKHLFEGAIDDVAVWNRVLDEREVLQLYRRPVRAFLAR